MSHDMQLIAPLNSDKNADADTEPRAAGAPAARCAPGVEKQLPTELTSSMKVEVTGAESLHHRERPVIEKNSPSSIFSV